MKNRALKINIFRAVLCLTAETLRVSPPLRLHPEALSRCSRGRYGGRSRGPYSVRLKVHSA